MTRNCAIVLAGLCALAGLARGATIAMVNTNDGSVGSFREAIQTASPGDTIVFGLVQTGPAFAVNITV